MGGGTAWFRPHRTRPGWSPLAAALLNLTGFGLGYVYLRRWWRFAPCVVIAFLLVVVALTNDAAGSPWLWRILAGLWVAGTAADAWWVAIRGPLLPSRAAAARPVAIGATTVLVVVAAYLGYGLLGQAAYATGAQAQERADCAAANGSFALVGSLFELTLSSNVPAAQRRHTECTEFLAAERAATEGDNANAVAGFTAFRQAHPDSVLGPKARERTIDALQVLARDLHVTGDLSVAIDRYRELVDELGADPRGGQARADLAAAYVERAAAARATMATAAGQDRAEALRQAMEDLMRVSGELSDTPVAAEVPRAIQGVFAEANNAVGEGRYCDALPVLDYAVTLPATAGIAQAANRDRARSLSECGVASFNAGDLTNAVTRFERLIADYPDHPGTAQARSALIAAEVGRAASIPIPLPAPAGASGPVRVILYNAVSTEVRVLVTGPTAHEVTLAGCPDCPQVYEGGGDSCPGAAGKPALELSLRTGRYYVMQDRTSQSPDESVDRPVDVGEGGGELCVTVSRD